MQLKLNIYADESMTEIKRTVEADNLKIPYRVAMHLIQSLDTVSLDNEDDVLKFITGNVEKMDKIIKATFGVKDDELDCIDTMELIETIKELYKWATENVNKLKVADNSKNVLTPVSQ